jgi:hypothetical protein
MRLRSLLHGTDTFQAWSMAHQDEVRPEVVPCWMHLHHCILLHGVHACGFNMGCYQLGLVWLRLT